MDGAPAPAITADDLDFSDIKKKKKSSKKKPTFDLEEFEKELNQSKSKSSGTDGAGAAEDEDGEGLGENNFEEVDEAELGENPFARAMDAPVGVDAGNEAWLKSDRDYTYSEVRIIKFLCAYIVTNSCMQLLTRFYGQLHAANPALLSSTSGKRYTIAPPSIHREGNKKTIFANIADICKRMHRQASHQKYNMLGMSKFLTAGTCHPVPVC